MSDQLLSLQKENGIKNDPAGTGNIKSGKMISRNLIIILISSLMLFSCTGKEEKPSRKGLIPEKDLVPILIEIHIADGLLPNPRIRNWVLSVDSISIYNYIIEKHGYTKELFDKTMHYYFVRKPKKLISIYDRILGKLSEMESLLEKEVMLTREHSSNLWPGERNYYFPDTSGVVSSIDFELSLAGGLSYSLKFTATIFPDDQSVNPRASVFTYDADSVLTGSRSYYKTIDFLKDGQPHTYTISLPAFKNKAIMVKGNLYEFENQMEVWQKHVSLENITLSVSTAEI